MSEAEDQILRMLAEGKITAEEADKLLLALGPDDAVTTVAGEPVLATEPSVKRAPGLPPDFERMRHRWRVPLLIAGGSLLLSTAGLVLLYQASGDVAFVGFLCLWSIFIPAVLATFLVLLASRSTWLHVKIEEKEGRRFSFSLPIPVRWAGRLIHFARRFVGQEQARHLDNASAFISAMEGENNDDPIIFEVDDDDGDRVQIYLG